MAKLWAVIKREYLERVRTKWFIISTVFGPLFFLGIMVLPGLMSVRGMKEAQVSDVRILDATGRGLGERVVTALRQQAERDPLKALGGTMPVATQGQVVVVAPAQLAEAESTATHAIMRKELRSYLVLDATTLSEAKARTAGRNAGGIGENAKLEGAIRRAILADRLSAEGLDATRIDSLTRINVDLMAEKIGDRGRGGSGTVSIIFGFIISFLLYMMIILYGQNVLRGVLEEKTTRVSEVVVASVKPDILLAGKVLGVGAVGLTQQLVWLAFSVGVGTYGVVAAKMMGVPGMAAITLPQVTVIQMIALVLFFLLGYVFYSTLFAAVGAMCGSQEEAQQASQPVMMLLVASIIFVQPIITNPTGGLARTMSLLPFSAPIIMPLRMAVTEVPMTDLAIALVGLAVGCWAAIWVSARIYRVGLLMYGKRPDLKELIKWIRYA